VIGFDAHVLFGRAHRHGGNPLQQLGQQRLLRGIEVLNDDTDDATAGRYPLQELLQRD
jgi:hypothetical protein